MVKKLVVACFVLTILCSPARATTRLKNICRIKGQEENVLRGYGLVVGLNGTGEANDPIIMQAIARSMELMGHPLSGSRQGAYEELRKIKNAAAVLVTAKVPATGARRGDQLDCFVSGINGKSLAGGRLAFASLQGPNTQDPRVYALCQGQVTIDDETQPMVGVVHGGCQMEADIFTPFFKDGHITFVLDKNHANFWTADEVANMIEEKWLTEYAEDNQATRSAGGNARPARSEHVVRAIDAANIMVRIPDSARDDPVGFASELLEIRVVDPEPEARVVINPRAGTIVISGDVEIGDVIVSHKNVVVEAAAATADTFARIDVDESNKPKLDKLVSQLNSLKVPTSDVIEIIRGIERNGKLHARLIVE